MRLLLLLMALTLAARPVHSGGSEEDAQCFRAAPGAGAGAECQPLESSTCLDVTLPYKHTSPLPFTNQSHVHAFLQRFTGLRKVPRCWTAFESVVCTLLLPRCDVETRRSFLPTQDMCRNAKNHCKIIEPLISSLCDNQSLFPTDCENRYRDLKFLNPSATKCLSPILVASEDSDIWFPGIEGCAFNCSDARYAESDKVQLDYYLYYASLVGMILTATSCITIHISKPIEAATSAIFYQCFCMFMLNFGFFFIKTFTSKADVVCRFDSSLRYSEPGSSNENRWLCICTFLFMYFFAVASFVWRVNLSLAFSQKFDISRTSSNGQQLRRKQSAAKSTYYHMAAWSTPIMLIVIIICMSEIDASFLIGTCFVGFNRLLTRVLFVLAPNAASVLLACFFMIKCLVSLFQVYRMQSASKDGTVLRKDKRMRDKIKSLIIQIFLTITFELAFLVIVAYANVFEFYNSPAWNNHLQSSVICSLNVTSLSLPGVAAPPNAHSCPDPEDSMFSWSAKPMHSSGRPASLKHVYLQIMCVFLWNILVSSWTWRKESLLSWRSYIYRLLGGPNLNARDFIRMQEIVEKAYAVHKNNNQTDHVVGLSCKFNDPVGLNLTSATSNEMSTTFMEAFVNNLRNGKPLPANGAITSKKRTRPLGQPKRKFKFMFKSSKDKYADGSSISDGSVFRSNAANSSVAESMNLGSAGTSRLSLEDMQDLKAMVTRQRRKTRNQLNQLLTPRHGSDTSGHPAARPVQARPPTQQTATSLASQTLPTAPHPASRTPITHSSLSADSMLLQMQYSWMLQQALSSQQSQLAAQSGSRVLPLPAFAQPPPSVHPVLQPQEPADTFCHSHPAINRLRPTIRSTLPGGPLDFCHGMNDQAQSLLNPLTEARRTDSRDLFHQPNYHVVVQPTFNPFLGASPLLRSLHAPPPPTHLPAFLAQNQLLGNSLSSGPFPVPVPNPTVSTEEELQSLMRERAECLDLVRQVDSGSEFGDGVLPILMSDSEAVCTDGETATIASKASNNSNLLIQRAVTQRMEQVEAQAAAQQPEQPEEPPESAPLLP